MCLWREKAACIGHGAIFVQSHRFLTQRHAERKPAMLAAILMCSRCPVLEECTDWVLNTRPDPCPEHIVAGMTAVERGKKKRQLDKLRVR